MRHSQLFKISKVKCDERMRMGVRGIGLPIRGEEIRRGEGN